MVLKSYSVRNVGAGLLAKAVGQLMNLVADTPHSRASPLPQVDLHLVWRIAICSRKNSAFDSTTQVGFQAAVL